MSRTRLGCQAWNLKEQFNIPFTTVHLIINSYIAYCKELLLAGEVVEFLGLVTLIPDYRVSDFSPTLAYNCTKVAERLSLPNRTVYYVMKEYLNNALESLKNNTIVEIRGLVVIKPITDADGNIIKVYSHISQALKNILGDTEVTLVRVSTYKSLRDYFNKGEIH